MARIPSILIGAVAGIAWAASLRGFMQQLAGPESNFTFTGTVGIIIPTGSSPARFWAGPNTSAAPAPNTGCSSWPR
jgi:hypothetical protein